MNVVKDLTIGNPPDQVNVFIEVPRGSKNKYELDKDTGLVTLDRVLYTPFVYPMDYGLIPQTHWHDGDPIDVVVLNAAEPYVPGAVVPARPVGVIRMIDDGERDEKVICVPVDSPQLAGVKDQGDITPHLLEETKYFFEHYKDLQGKKVTVEGIDSAAAAKKVIEEAVALYKKEIAG